MPEWPFLTSTTEADDGLMIGGLRVWDHKWKLTGQGIKVSDPLYGNLLGPPVYEIGPRDGPIRFAAEELSPGVFGFWVPDETAEKPFRRD